MVKRKAKKQGASSPIYRSLLALWIGSLLSYGLLFLLETNALLIENAVPILSVMLFMLLLFMSLAYWFYQNSEWKLGEFRGEYEAQVEAERNKRFHDQKLQSLGRLGAGIAHEINNPLAIIKTRTTLWYKKLGQLGPIDPDSQKNHDIIAKQTDRIQAIVKSLQQLTLDTSREERLPVSVCTTLETVREYLQLRDGIEKVKIQWDQIPKELSVLSQPTELVQILYNLIGNAIDAVKNDPDPWVKLSLKPNENKTPFVFIAIQDSGGPLDPEIIEKIFEPFFTTKQVGQGPGLGLSLCKQMAQNQGGDLIYDDSAPRTTFVLNLERA